MLQDGGDRLRRINHGGYGGYGGIAKGGGGVGGEQEETERRTGRASPGMPALRLAVITIGKVTIKAVWREHKACVLNALCSCSTGVQERMAAGGKRMPPDSPQSGPVVAR